MALRVEQEHFGDEAGLPSQSWQKIKIGTRRQSRCVRIIRIGMLIWSRLSRSRNGEVRIFPWISPEFLGLKHQEKLGKLSLSFRDFFRLASKIFKWRWLILNRFLSQFYPFEKKFGYLSITTKTYRVSNISLFADLAILEWNLSELT